MPGEKSKVKSMIQKNSSDKSKLHLNFWLIVIFGAIAAASLFFGLIFFGQTNVILAKKLDQIKEAARPAELEIVILQDENCPDCFDVSPVVQAIKKTNVKINSEKVVQLSSAEGKELVQKYKITIAPSLIVSGELAKEASLREIWSQLGEVKDNTFVLRQAGAPYVLASSGEIKGRVQTTLLADRNCGECYDVTLHETVLKRFGISKANSKVVDINIGEGAELRKKYNIKLVPTLILEGDVEAYKALTQIWAQVGTVENDGVYILREGVKQMGTYKDLTTGKIVKPATVTK